MNNHAIPSLVVLIAGPYRSGTGDDPGKLLANLHALEAFALPLWQKGHLPMIGEWVALPLIRVAGGRHVADAVHGEYLYPVARRLLDRCDAVLRVGGPSKGADEDVRLASERGLPVYRSIEDVPAAGSARASLPEVTHARA